MRNIFFTILLSVVSLTAFAQSGKTRELKVGDKIPGFSLRDQDGKLFKSADYLGKKNLVIFFYPKDESLVCTKEACSFRDNFADFNKAGAVVLGINQGSVQSHKNFQKKESLPFSLLSDPDNRVLKLFGVPNQLFMPGRKTFLVDKQGTIVFTYDSAFNGSAHAREALAYLRKVK